MFGYILAVLIGLVLLAFLIGGLAQMRPGRQPSHSGQESPPLQADTPAADEPTPDRSVTATATEISAAKRHTPPA